jgi:membrane protein implicated in regulation of membrane protease activity
MNIWTALNLDIVYIVVWVVIFFAAVLIEALEPQLVSIWFAGGALLTLIVASIFNAGIIAQALTFIVSTGVLLYLTKPIVKKVINGRTIATNADALIGKEILVETTFSLRTSGKGRMGDVMWKLVTQDDVTFKQGEYVLIKKIDGNKLIVTKKEG